MEKFSLLDSPPKGLEVEIVFAFHKTFLNFTLTKPKWIVVMTVYPDIWRIIPQNVFAKVFAMAKEVCS